MILPQAAPRILASAGDHGAEVPVLWGRSARSRERGARPGSLPRGTAPARLCLPFSGFFCSAGSQVYPQGLGEASHSSPMGLGMCRGPRARTHGGSR